MPLNQTAREILQRNLHHAETHADYLARRLNDVAKSYAEDIADLAKAIAENNKIIADLRAQLKD